jgi:hypothetical protein
MLPAGLKDFSPDAVAVGPSRKLVVEVVREGAASKARLRRLRELLGGQTEWELRAVLLSPIETPLPVGEVSRRSIEETLALIDRLIKEGRKGPALLMSWATFEAISRSILPEKFAKPQTPGRIVEVLANSGHITPSDADRLRSLADARNKLVHGGLNAPIKVGELRDFLTLLRRLMQLETMN